jgi:hypothetical protein
MSNPFQEHAQNRDDYLAMLKGDDNSGGATLTIKLKPPVTVDCTFERIIDNFDQVSGQSPKLIVQQCVFSVATIPADALAAVRKGLFCSLKPNPNAEPIALRLWVGGLEQGGLAWRGDLASENYSA